MHLYVHEFEDIKYNKVKELRELLFKNSLNDYRERLGSGSGDLKLEKNKHGKPFFPDVDDIHFSVSHSGRYWICLFDETEVGVDIEDHSRRKLSSGRLMDISKRFFTTDERGYLRVSTAVDNDETAGSYNETADEELKKRFFKIWTAKEAFMKFTGKGFSQGFRNFSVLSNDRNVYFREVPVDPNATLTFCSVKNRNLDELINV